MTKAGPQTYQLRVAATALATGHLIIADSSSTAVAVLLPLATAFRGEYVTITPGQWYLPAPSMFVTEMS